MDPIKRMGWPAPTTAPAPSHDRRGMTLTNDTATRLEKNDAPIFSREVCWWDVHEYVNPVLQHVGSWPMVGSVEWKNADDADKVASILDAARHWALRIELAQQASAEASHDVSAAADWAEVSASWRRHNDAVTSGAYIPRVAA